MFLALRPVSDEFSSSCHEDPKTKKSLEKEKENYSLKSSQHPFKNKQTKKRDAFWHSHLAYRNLEFSEWKRERKRTKGKESLSGCQQRKNCRWERHARIALMAPEVLLPLEWDFSFLCIWFFERRCSLALLRIGRAGWGAKAEGQRKPLPHRKIFSPRRFLWFLCIFVFLHRYKNFLQGGRVSGI